MFCTTPDTEDEFGAVKMTYYLPFQGGSFVVVLCCLFWCQGFCDVFYVCSYYFSSVSVGEWPPFWEIAAYSVDHMFYL